VSPTSIGTGLGAVRSRVRGKQPLYLARLAKSAAREPRPVDGWLGDRYVASYRADRALATAAHHATTARSRYDAAARIQCDPLKSKMSATVFAWER
jgi:hypothetical protein